MQDIFWTIYFVALFIFGAHTVIGMIYDRINRNIERAKFRKKFMTDFDRKNVNKIDELIAEMQDLKKTIGGY